MKRGAIEADLEMLHSFLLLKHPGPFVGRTLHTVRHASENNLRDLET